MSQCRTHHVPKKIEVACRGDMRILKRRLIRKYNMFLWRPTLIMAGSKDMPAEHQNGEAYCVAVVKIAQ